jgi:MarR family transcriptional regulator, organic hydroperoxide resistance regulator
MGDSLTAEERKRVLHLDEQLCFALHSAARAYDAVYRRILADSGLTYPQYLVMLVLWQHGEMSVKGLGEHLRLDSGTLSPLVKRMEAAGLVRRERSADDERSVMVLLTPDGAALRERALTIPHETLEATGLDREGLFELRSRLKRLTAALEEDLSSRSG